MLVHVGCSSVKAFNISSRISKVEAKNLTAGSVLSPGCAMPVIGSSMSLNGCMMMPTPLRKRVTPASRTVRGVTRAGMMSTEEVEKISSGVEKTCPSWTTLEAMKSEAEATPELALRLAAAKIFDSETCWEVIDDPSTLDACAGVFGDLGQAAKIADEHVRLLVDCLLRDQPKATIEFYNAFKAVRYQHKSFWHVTFSCEMSSMPEIHAYSSPLHETSTSAESCFFLVVYIFLVTLDEISSNGHPHWLFCTFSKPVS